MIVRTLLPYRRRTGAPDLDSLDTAMCDPTMAEFEYQLVSMVDGYSKHVTDYVLVAEQSR
jgi:hypothetical protein